FAEHWVRAFPDAVMTVQRLTPRSDSMVEVDVLVKGIHQGILTLGPGLSFKPAGVLASVRLRELLDIRDERIVFASISLDVQDVINQLVTVDHHALTRSLSKIRTLTEQLMST